MNSRNSGKRLESFFAGRGFYIVLFLCAAVIGVSAWMTAAGNGTMNAADDQPLTFSSAKIETVVLPPVTEAPAEVMEVLPMEESDGAMLSEVWHQGDMLIPDAPEYVWPVTGELERSFCMDGLCYDVTMRDWRTHEAVDILAPMGEQVLAAHKGTVTDIYEDDFYGTVMVIDHGDGSTGIYANLAALPAVSIGDTVSAGDVIGSVGDTALCEIGQGTHLHFAMTMGDEYVDPAEYLPS